MKFKQLLKAKKLENKDFWVQTFRCCIYHAKFHAHLSELSMKKVLYPQDLFTHTQIGILYTGGDYSRTVIVFMTDGADTVSPKEMLPKMAGTLANRWQEINKEVTIHAVGFTSSEYIRSLCLEYIYPF